MNIKTIRLHLHALSEYRRLWWRQWSSPSKRGNRFPTPPLRERLTMAHRMAACGRTIVLGPPYCAPRYMRRIVG